jgi:hypothetical protein
VRLERSATLHLRRASARCAAHPAARGVHVVALWIMLRAVTIATRHSCSCDMSFHVGVCCVCAPRSATPRAIQSCEAIYNAS